MCVGACACVPEGVKETKGPKRVFCIWKTRSRAEHEEEGRSPPGELSKGSEGERGSLRGRESKTSEGEVGLAPGDAGDTGGSAQEGPGPGGGGGALSRWPFSPLPALGQATPAEAPAGLTRGERQQLTCGRAPPFLPTSPGWRALPGGGSRWPRHPAPRLLSGYLGGGLWRWRLAAVSTLVPGGAPAQAPTLPPSQAPTLGRGGGSRGSGNLRGGRLRAGAPHYSFISRGPAKNNAGHETAGT